MEQFIKDWYEACRDTDDIEAAQDEVLEKYWAEHPELDHQIEIFLAQERAFYLNLGK